MLRFGVQEKAEKSYAPLATRDTRELGSWLGWAPRCAREAGGRSGTGPPFTTLGTAAQYDNDAWLCCSYILFTALREARAHAMRRHDSVPPHDNAHWAVWSRFVAHAEVWIVIARSGPCFAPCGAHRDADRAAVTATDGSRTNLLQAAVKGCEVDAGHRQVNF